MRSRRVSDAVIVFTLIVAWGLDNLPIPVRLEIWRPQFVLLVLLYWQFSPIASIGAGRVFIFGILTDLCSQALLGMHAFAWLLVYGLLDKVDRRFQFYPLLGQGGVMLVLLGVNYLLNYGMMWLTAGRPVFSHYYYPLLSTILFWPLIWGMLSQVAWRYRRI